MSQTEAQRRAGQTYRRVHPERHNARARRYAIAHPDRIEAAWRRRAEKINRIIADAKDRPCADCGRSYPKIVMDFDHVHGEKSFNIGANAFSHSFQAVLDEIAKCDVVCSNCHRMRTAERRTGGV